MLSTSCSYANCMFVMYRNQTALDTGAGKAITEDCRSEMVVFGMDRATNINKDVPLGMHVRLVFVKVLPCPIFAALHQQQPHMTMLC